MEEQKKTSLTGRVTRLLVAIALVLALALALVYVGRCMSSSEAVAAVRSDVKELRRDVTDAAKGLEERLERIEGKIDALIKIATTPPPDAR